METQNFKTQQDGGVEQTPTYPQPEVPHGAPRGSFSQRYRLTIKIALIAVMVLLLLIPMFMIGNMIDERKETAKKATLEVHQKWSGSQRVAGPVLTIPYYIDAKGVKDRGVNILNILPERLEISGDIGTSELKRGLYEIVVYEAPIELKGSFVLPESVTQSEIEDWIVDGAMINIGISDLRGLGDQVVMAFSNQTLTFDPGIKHRVIISSGVSSKVDIRELLARREVEFSVKLQLKGSESLMFVPFGKTTEVSVTSNCATPSFTGAFLPTSREVTNDGFTGSWRVMHLNRNYPQVITDGSDYSVTGAISNSAFGVDMLLPVQHYQKSMRSVKYALLIILLTFVVSFFVEILHKRDIHPVQYMLIGLALCLFYALLISLSEHTSFTIAYAIASAMTVVLVTCYMAGVVKIKKTALMMGGLLTCLYIYIYVLIQMETYALLAGSVGLFAILALIMYVSQKINWNGQR